ncbi:hypothetical protein HHL22_18165 [Hymenobacter sp. RP-2-7]|uniref:PH domain-containing protein n=1 Tax=Hymenobacter polaris TaxID=2682546 RepID=A0A7Y0AH12_9BACT|nr:hypothetical protein [Hymenobacter polaris]NML67134.1 hypothetical protein [Hymenobacter polaris]
MPTHSPAALAARPGLRSLVVRNPRSQLAAWLFGLGLLLVPLAALQAAQGSYQRATTAGLLSLGLLLLTTRQITRRNPPMLLTSDREGLHLAPLGHRAQGQPAETIPLASIQAYQYWLRLLRWRVFAQGHLRLELADGRVLHLADRPGTHPDDPTGTVRLDAVVRRLARRKTGPVRRPLFFQTRPAHVLRWGSWGAIAIGGVLLGLGYPAGLLPLLGGLGYGASYYLWHDADEPAA